MPSPDDPEDNDERVEKLLARAYEMADSGLTGINEAAEELATLSGDDLAVISKARRVIIGRLQVRSDRETNQVHWLIRRALELGGWRWHWEDTNPVP